MHSSKRPRILIFGRPNVGKSTLFNLLLKRRYSITAHEAGITRDYLEEDCEVADIPCRLIDSGGVGDPSDDIAVLAEQRTRALLEDVDIILFLVETNGLTVADHHIADSLRTHAARVIVVVNKADRMKEPVDNYLQMGYSSLALISAAHNQGIDDLGALIAEKMIHLKDVSVETAQQSKQTVSLSIAGRPNVGKSTLLNTLLGFERALVSDVPGVTRDSVQANLLGKHSFTLVDTAGIRKGRLRKDRIEFFANLRAYESTGQTDSSLVLIDAKEGMTEQDARIASQIMEQGTPVLFVVNKWDLARESEEDFQIRMRTFFPRLRVLPIVFCSALKGSGISSILPAIRRIVQRASKRIPTPQLNKRLRMWTQRFPIPMKQGKRTKIFYVTQVAVSPPHFVFMVNRMAGIDKRYSQYLENRIREDFYFEAVPLKIEFQKKAAS